MRDTNRENLMMDGTRTKPHIQHSLWRIGLILTALLAFILVCVFNGLSSRTTNGLFKKGIGKVSDENNTEFTPAGWTFSIWGIIYFWQAAWLLYAISRIPRKSNADYLYIVPDTLHYFVFVFYILNLILNIIWLFVWDREHFGGAFFVLLFMLITAAAPLIITHILLQRNRSIYIESDRRLDIWLVRLFVHNGLAIYCTWLYLATILNLIVWICRTHDRHPQTIIDASTAGLSLVLFGIIAYFICENFLFYSSLAYTFIPWFVLIFALSGIRSKINSKGDAVSSRNKSFVIGLLILACILFVIRVGLFIFRYIKRKIPTIQEP